MSELAEKVREKVSKVIDPETGMTLGEMNVIRNVKDEGKGIIRVDFKPTSPFCPIALKLATDIKRAAESVEGVKKALVYCHEHIMEEAINKVVNRED